MSFFTCKLRLIVAVLIYLCPNGLCANYFNKFHTKAGYKMDDRFTYGTSQVVNVYRCGIRCQANTQCKTASYNAGTGVCTLSDHHPVEYDAATMDTHYVTDAAEWVLISSMTQITGSDIYCMDVGYPTGERCYKLFWQSSTFTQANQTCLNVGGKLAEPSTAEENEAIKNVLKQFTLDVTWWNGLTDEADEGEWVWLMSGHAPNFTDWATDNPNQGTSANCGCWYAGHNYKWGDEQCTTPYKPLCELPGVVY